MFEASLRWAIGQDEVSSRDELSCECQKRRSIRHAIATNSDVSPHSRVTCVLCYFPGLQPCVPQSAASCIINDSAASWSSTDANVTGHAHTVQCYASVGTAETLAMIIYSIANETICESRCRRRINSGVLTDWSPCTKLEAFGPAITLGRTTV